MGVNAKQNYNRYCSPLIDLTSYGSHSGFDKGKINEDGTHRELLAKAGLYKTLWDAQVGFLGDEQTKDEV